MNSTRGRGGSINAASMKATESVDGQRMPNTADCDVTALSLLARRGTEGEMEAQGRSDDLEEIDTEDDDVEFDERAHWGRRRTSGKRPPKSARSKQIDKNQPKINIFCVVTASLPGETQSQAGCASPQLREHAVGSEEELDEAGTSPQLQYDSSQSCSTALQWTQHKPNDETSSSSPVHHMQSGRLTRRAVQKGEEAKLNEGTSFMTPPATHSSKRIATFSTTQNGDPARRSTTSDINAPQSTGRKRKLEMAGDKKKSLQSIGVAPAKGSGGAKAAQSTFFLTGEEKKQVIEIKAIASFKEHLREQRERDLAFFGNHEAKNPFFQVRGMSSAQRPIDVEAQEIIEVLDTPESSPAKERKPRWSRELEIFPAEQHVLRFLEGEDIGPSTNCSLILPRKEITTEQKDTTDQVVSVQEDDEDMSLSATTISTFSPDSADVQVPFDDQFWLLSSPTPCWKQEVSEIFGNLSEDVFVDKMSTLFNLKEKRVRKLLSSLELARSKRQDKSLNLSLVDKYLPVQTSGMIGNKPQLKKLAAWLGAWKNGGLDRQGCDDSLIVFEGDDSDEDEGTQLYRLFILKGDTGTGKSAAVYACADELGYEIIEINAGQLRTGKAIVDIAGEATQSSRVLHSSRNVVDKQKNSNKTKKRRAGSTTNKPSHLSLVLFEDVDLIFEDDKGFFSTLSSIAKHSKCPIVVTCRHLPDAFPTSPLAISERLVRPSRSEFVAWLLLVAYLERIVLSSALSRRLADLYECDVRRTLHFLEAYRLRIGSISQRPPRPLSWKPAEIHTSIDAGRDPGALIDITSSHDDVLLTCRSVPAWSLSTIRSFDLLTSNFLSSLEGSACDGVQLSVLRSRPQEEKQRQVSCINDVWEVLESVSFADELDSRSRVCDPYFTCEFEETEATHFESERDRILALDVRMISLSNFAVRRKLDENMLALGNCPLSDAVGRAFQAANEAKLRLKKQLRLAELKRKLELPLVVKGSEIVGASFSTDYLPMVALISENCEPFQESRRRSSRRNHYLRAIVMDMSTMDDLRDIQACFPHTTKVDDEVVPLSASSPFDSTDNTSICI